MDIVQRIADAAEAHSKQHAGMPPGVLFLGLRELEQLRELLDSGKAPSGDPNTFTLVSAINWQGMSVQAVLTATLLHVQ